jgi:sulfate adenylyltransferase subunit 1
VTGRTYWALHGHRWVKAKVKRIVHQLDVQTLERKQADELGANAIAQVELVLQAALPLQPFAMSRELGRLILVDMASHATAAAVLIDTLH